MIDYERRFRLEPADLRKLADAMERNEAYPVAIVEAEDTDVRQQAVFGETQEASRMRFRARERVVTVEFRTRQGLTEILGRSLTP